MVDLRDVYDSKTRLMKLVDPNGVIDSFLVADALSRGVRFDHQDAALRIAAGAVKFNAAATWIECDHWHPYNMRFIRIVRESRADILTGCEGLGVKEVILPHAFDRILGYLPRKTKALISTETQMNSRDGHMLVSGVRISLRPEPYGQDLSPLGRRRRADLMVKSLMAGDYQPIADLMVKSLSGDSYEFIKVGQLFDQDGRGMTSATDQIKRIWDGATRNEYGPPRSPVQMDLFAHAKEKGLDAA